MRIVVAITGASGVILGRELTEYLKSGKAGGHEVHLIISRAASKIAGYENVDLESLRDVVDRHYGEEEIDASLASSSYPVDAMVVIPCSMKTLAAMANGLSDNLVTRCAENILKMGKKLVVVPRDTPLSLAALENMTKLKKQGALIAPPVMAYYYNPKSMEDANGFFVGKVLDCLGIEHELYKRWEGIR